MRTPLTTALVTVACLGTVACERIPGTDQNRLANVRQRVAGELIDPGSAQFSGVKLTDTGRACGYVNGKNRFGGYVGKTRFTTRANGEVDLEPQGAAFTNTRETRVENMLACSFDLDFRHCQGEIDGAQWIKELAECLEEPSAAP